MTDFLDEIQHKKNLIKHQHCFSDLTESETEVLATLLIKKHVPKGATIVTEGDVVDGFYLIAEGNAEVISHAKVIAILKAENYDAIGLNETGFYSLSGLRTATVIATDDMIAYYVALPLFHGFVLNYPHVSQIMREQAEKFLSSSV
ncbi:MAG TPA: cyclic nucleotide-binding domain-containing protein [Gammaproteobacteria bacterium]|jgi:CRP-like cAMP-binding protein|nr:cyclic nucleotide-binding domain-containing protein [Gammaproteobacteria bacterium]